MHRYVSDEEEDFDEEGEGDEEYDDDGEGGGEEDEEADAGGKFWILATFDSCMSH